MTSGGATDTPLANAEPVGESVQTPYRRFLEDFCENKIAVVSFIADQDIDRITNKENARKDDKRHQDDNDPRLHQPSNNENRHRLLRCRQAIGK